MDKLSVSLPVDEDLLGEGVLRDEGPPALMELEEVDPCAAGEGLAGMRPGAFSPGTPAGAPMATEVGVGESDQRCSNECGCRASM